MSQIAGRIVRAIDRQSAAAQTIRIWKRALTLMDCAAGALLCGDGARFGAAWAGRGAPPPIVPMPPGIGVFRLVPIVYFGK